MNFPTNVKYTKEHEWIRLEGDVAYVGITDYAQEQLGTLCLSTSRPKVKHWLPTKCSVPSK